MEKEKTMEENVPTEETAQSSSDLVGKDLPVGWKGYAMLFVAFIFFSGLAVIAATSWEQNWLKTFDFAILGGKFGTMMDPAKATFQGQGGAGARGGFLMALTLFPTVMFALGFIEVVDHYGGLRAAQKLMNPLLRPLLGIPGLTGLALISSLQSTDAGSGMTKALFDEGLITEKEKTIFAAFQFTAGGTIPNYLSLAAAVMSALVMPLLWPLLVVMVFKVIGANIVRFGINRFVKELD